MRRLGMSADEIEVASNGLEDGPEVGREAGASGEQS
jgi:hypothetical protein